LRLTKIATLCLIVLQIKENYIKAENRQLVPADL